MTASPAAVGETAADPGGVLPVWAADHRAGHPGPTAQSDPIVVPTAGPQKGPALGDITGRVPSAGPTGVLLPQRGYSRGTRRAHPRELW